MTFEQEIIAAEARRYRAIVAVDQAELRACLDEQLVYVHSNAVVEDRETYIARLVSGERRYFSFTPGSRAFRVLGEAVACIGDVEVQGQSEAGPVTVRIAFTAVYRRAPDWKMVLWHASGPKRS